MDAYFNKETLTAMAVALEARERVLVEASKDALQAKRSKMGLRHIRNALATIQAMQRGDLIAIVWSSEDVQHLTDADNDEPIDTISLGEARQTLALVADSHHADVGVSWDTVRDALWAVREDRAANEAND